MCNTDTRDVKKTVKQIKALAEGGCEIIRLAVTDQAAALAIKKIKRQASLPIVADIHFDYRLALAAADAGADKIRINPGNIGSEKKIKEVTRACRLHNIPIRVGVNIGSLNREIEAKYGRTTETTTQR